MNEDDRIGLQNEIDILTHVDHPNIVKLYEVYEDESSYSLVMELMTGGEVSSLMMIHVILRKILLLIFIIIVI